MTIWKLFHRGKPSRRRYRVRSGDIVMVVVLASILLAIIRFRHNPGDLLGLLYSPTAGVIIVVMIAEYLWLKSGDRTRVYSLEIDRLRTQRRRDEELLRRAHEIVNQAIEHPETEEKGRPGDWRQKAVDLRKDMSERL